MCLTTPTVTILTQGTLASFRVVVLFIITEMTRDKLTRVIVVVWPQDSARRNQCD